MAGWTEENTAEVEELYQNPVSINYNLADEEEQKKIDEVRSITQPDLDTLRVKPLDIVGDVRLLRILRANRGSVEKTTKAVKKYVVARKANDGFIEKCRDMVDDWTPDQCREYYEKRINPHFVMLPFQGNTKDGDVLSYAILKNYNIKSMLKNKPADRPIDYEFWIVAVIMEWRFMYLDQKSRELNRMCYFIEGRDMKDCKMSVSDMTSSASAAFRELFQGPMDDVWVENHSSVVIVNGGSTLKAIMKVSKAFMSKRHADKLLCVGKMSKEDNVTKLHKYIPRDLCPPAWKGKNTELEKNIKTFQDEWNPNTIKNEYPKTKTLDVFGEGPIDFTKLPALVGSPACEAKYAQNLVDNHGAKLAPKTK